MAHFRGVIHGSKGIASRLGTKESGLIAVINGWKVGVIVRCSHKDDRDVIRVSRTGGSGGRGHETELIRITELDLE